MHPVVPLLLQYTRNGCHVDVGRNWTKKEIMTAAERGPHKASLALDVIEMMHAEVAEKVEDVFFRGSVLG